MAIRELWFKGVQVRFSCGGQMPDDIPAIPMDRAGSSSRRHCAAHGEYISQCPSCSTPTAAEDPGFEKSLEHLLNRYSQENRSNTPDFILAQFLLGCLAAWNASVQRREQWYGRGAAFLASTDTPNDCVRKAEQATFDSGNPALQK
jgi:hypothetical protein